MKREYLGWIVALVVVAAGAAAKVPPSEFGRYQVSWGTRTIVDKGGASVEWQEVLLLDTATGRAWAASPVAGKSTKWLPFDHGPDAP